MRCNKGQADGVHVLLVLFIIVLFVTLGFTCFMLYQGKQTNNSQYQAHSNPIIPDESLHCSPFSCCNDKVDEYFERKLQNVVNNKTND